MKSSLKIVCIAAGLFFTVAFLAGAYADMQLLIAPISLGWMPPDHLFTASSSEVISYYMKASNDAMETMAFYVMMNAFMLFLLLLSSLVMLYKYIRAIYRK